MRRPWDDILLAGCFTVMGAAMLGLVAVFTGAETSEAVVRETVRAISPMLAVV
ncbi:hypothetical protein ACFL51_01995 [Myxococcota bacterium]